MATSITPAVFSILTRLIEERSGLHYEPTDLELVADRVDQRSIERGFESHLDYYYFLRYDPAGSEELDALVESLVIHETYFFREAQQLTALVDTHLAPMIAAGKRPRVWCAACATGEEPLTLAMLLGDRGLLGSTELLASDVSANALRRAREGRFNGRSLRAMPADARARWLDETGPAPRVNSSLMEAIHWERINLLDAAAIGRLGSFDAILCRNVLIYFADETAMRVVATLSSALRPGGRLLVGVSESLLRFGSALRCEERGGAFFYEKAT